MTTTNNEALLKGFLTKLPDRSPASIADRINHWADVANDPGQYTNGDISPYALKSRRKIALQSLKKLIARNPEIAAQALQEREQLEVA
jgi:hypothetical protein